MFKVDYIFSQSTTFNHDLWGCFFLRRIVARIDQLMSLCDELEAELLHSQADSEKLMESVVGKMLAE
jgi:hypothetical protein